MYLLCRRCGAQTPGWDVRAPVRPSPTVPPLRLLLDDPVPLTTVGPGEDPRRSAAMSSAGSVRPPVELRLLFDR